MNSLIEIIKLFHLGDLQVFFGWRDFYFLVFHDFTWMITRCTRRVFLPCIYYLRVLKVLKIVSFIFMGGSNILFRFLEHNFQDSKTFENVMTRLFNNIWIYINLSLDGCCKWMYQTFYGALVKLKIGFHICLLTSYGHANGLGIWNILTNSRFFKLKFFLSSISISEGGSICLLWMVDSWKGSRTKIWNIGWIFINFKSCNQNAIICTWPMIGNVQGLVIQFSWMPCKQ